MGVGVGWGGVDYSVFVLNKQTDEKFGCTPYLEYTDISSQINLSSPLFFFFLQPDVPFCAEAAPLLPHISEESG